MIFYHFGIWRFVFIDIMYKKLSIQSIGNSDAIVPSFFPLCLIPRTAGLFFGGFLGSLFFVDASGNPVSYTHLDIGRERDWCRGNKWHRPLHECPNNRSWWPYQEFHRIPTAWKWWKAVSYTHLDVYKRQPFTSHSQSTSKSALPGTGSTHHPRRHYTSRNPWNVQRLVR